MNKSAFQYVYFHLDTVYLHIFYKVCHILYVFGLNSTTCSQIVDVHLPSDQVTYDFIMDADLYNSFFNGSAYEKLIATFSVY